MSEYLQKTIKFICLNIKYLDLFCIPLGEVIVTWTLFIPIVCMSIYRLCFMTRTEHFVPVFVINLLISDLIQISTINFMVCISFEKYVMIMYPFSCFICLLICFLSITEVEICIVIMKGGNVGNLYAVSVTFLLLPYPLVVFPFVGSWRALPRSVSIPPEEQKRILIILVLVLFTYTVMFLPRENGKKSFLGYLLIVSGALIYLNLLVDCLRYVFMRMDAKGILKSFSCVIKVMERKQSDIQPYIT
uniref:G-protein coupled receptors family 1 profile domain-containing protein n=1 Tax=Pygocentrus nattereri TaxID=42514 RepID=A0A3B4E1C2_PYGNA